MRYKRLVPVFMLALLAGCGGMPTEPTAADLYKHYVSNFKVVGVSPAVGTTITAPAEVAVSAQFDITTPPLVAVMVFIREDGETFIVRVDPYNDSSKGQPRVPIAVAGVISNDAEKDVVYAFMKGHTINAYVLIFKGNGYPLNSGLTSTSKLDTTLLVEQYPIQLDWRFQ